MSDNEDDFKKVHHLQFKNYQNMFEKNIPISNYESFFAWVIIVFNLLLSFNLLISGYNSLDELIYTWLVGFFICFVSYIIIRPYTIYHVRKLTEIDTEVK